MMITSSSGNWGSASIMSVKRMSGPSNRRKEAGQNADQRAEGHGHEHGDNAHRERDAAAIHIARQQIAAQIIGPEWMFCAWRLAGVDDIDLLPDRPCRSADRRRSPKSEW